jgi:flavodoxin I
MKVLVAYMSQTGNTKKVAEEIFGEINDDKEIKKIDDVASLEGYDLAFLGFPIHGEKVEKKVANLLTKHCTAEKNIAFFVTHGSKEGDAPELQQWLAEFRQMASGANIVGMFDCQGQLAKAIKFVMSIYPNAKYRKWAKMDTSQGQPDESRLERARVFARQTMKGFHDMKRGGHSETGKRTPAAVSI